MDSGFVHFVEFELQIIALSWLVIFYVIKVLQLSRLPLPQEKEPRKGSPVLGALHSYTNIFIPWSMESSKKHFWRWVEFGAYHVGALIAILNTFTTPFAPGDNDTARTLGIRHFNYTRFPFRICQLARHISRPEMRLISNPDDYFSLASCRDLFLHRHYGAAAGYFGVANYLFPDNGSVPVLCALQQDFTLCLFLLRRDFHRQALWMEGIRPQAGKT